MQLWALRSGVRIAIARLDALHRSGYIPEWAVDRPSVSSSWTAEEIAAVETAVRRPVMMNSRPAL
jgi:hypothetical protein